MQHRSPAPELFAFADYQAFLQEWFQEQKRHNPEMSLPKLATILGLKSKGYLYRVMHNPDRPISPGLVARICSHLQFNRTETAFFEALVGFNRAKDSAEKALYYGRMHSILGASSTKVMPPEEYEFFRHWFVPVLREVAAYLPWKGNYLKLANAIDPSITQEQAKFGVELLLKLGFLKPTAHGGFCLAEPVLSTGHDLNSPALLEFHSSMIELAKRSLREHPIHKREIASITLGIPDALLPEYKRLVRRFLADAANLSNTKEPVDSVFQINVQCFPLTRSGGHNE